MAFFWVQFYKRYLSHQSLKLAWKLLIYFFFFSNLPGANELKVSRCVEGVSTSTILHQNFLWIQHMISTASKVYMYKSLILTSLINSLVPGKYDIDFKIIIFEHILRTKFMSLWSCSQANATKHPWWKVELWATKKGIISMNMTMTCCKNTSLMLMRWSDVLQLAIDISIVLVSP